MRGISFAVCARRNLCGSVFGHEFDSRQLHQFKEYADTQKRLHILFFRIIDIRSSGVIYCKYSGSERFAVI